MGLITITELVDVLKKHFVKILAFSLAVSIITMIAVENMQTYTCTLDFKYNHSEAVDGFAPDGRTKLNPYEIQEPLVLRSALDDMGLKDSTDINVEKVRSNIRISEVVQELDQEVSESAALLGEKYDVNPTEFKIKYTYSADWGEEFGAKFFDSLVTQYDAYLLKKYYNKKEIADFAKILNPDIDDYLSMAEVMSENIESTIEYFDSMAESYPEFRSKRTGLSFADLSFIYQNLRDIQYAKYYGNIRSGNLSKDSEMVIKNYEAKIKDLNVDLEIANDIAANYSGEILSFYDSYKETSLYRQALQMQSELGNTNNKDQNILENYDVDKLTNTYDGIVLKYTENAEEASEISRDIENYNAIIYSFQTDMVDEATKQTLLEKNEIIFNEIKELSNRYSVLANTTIDEYFDTKINEDLLYLIVTDIQTDKPVMVLVIFAFILSFGLLYIFFVIKKIIGKTSAKTEPEAEDEMSADMTELEQLFYKQYKQNFKECYLVYQPMLRCKDGKATNYEAFIRWNSKEYGAVSAIKTIECASNLNLLPQFNSWIIDKICESLAERKKKKGDLPIIHVNCPYFSVKDFGLADVIVKRTNEHGVSVKNICMEVESTNVMSCMEDLLILQKLGVKICVDRFENSSEQEEIFEALVPDYIKLSADVVNNDALATTEEEMMAKNAESLKFIIKTLTRCEKSKIEACICGIETTEQEVMFVKGMDFTYKQGYLYGKPMPYKK